MLVSNTEVNATVKCCLLARIRLVLNFKDDNDDVREYGSIIRSSSKEIASKRYLPGKRENSTMDYHSCSVLVAVAMS